MMDGFFFFLFFSLQATFFFLFYTFISYNYLPSIVVTFFSHISFSFLYVSLVLTKSRILNI
ncbi:MAG: hypothetical protein J3R72DRAFT_431649 [Linnemannia gamsii]|nr:MAG: hypothetical protein J3R72DRAFT_431649 [Linnemannia gamsii]